MKVRKVKTTDGGEVEVLTPETDADIDRLNEMLQAGKLAPPVDEEPVVE